MPAPAINTASGLAAISFSTWPVTLVSERAYFSVATIWMPFALNARCASASQPSPYASLNPMNPTVFTPFAAMWSAIASAMRLSFWGVLNTQCRCASIGSISRALAASVIIGTFFSAATSISAIEAGVVLLPMRASTLSSSISLRALATALVLSAASSSTIHSTFCPAISLGNNAIELRCGTPRLAAGPVVEIVTPILICARADNGAESGAITQAARSSVARRRFMVRSPRCFLVEQVVWPGMEGVNVQHAVMTTAEAVVASLVAHGIDTVYGVPGVHNDALFDALFKARNQVRMLHARHEQTGAYMALGAAMATGRPQAYAAVPGPGVLNTTAALLTAWATESPVLALAGQIPTHAIDRGYGHLHEIPDQLGLLRHLTKYAARITGPHEASAYVAAALHAALSGRRRPVALECAIDVWNQAGPAPAVAPIQPWAPEPDPDAVAQAARLLGAAKRPLIVVGGGAMDAAPEVRLLAEMLEAPVVSYRRGRGILPTSHRLSVPFPVGRRLWETADVVFGVGTRLYAPQSQWGTDAELQVVRLDIDAEEPGRFRQPACAIVADAATGLRALLERLPGQNQARESREAELEGHRAWLAERLSRLEPQLGFLRAMRAALPEDGLLVDEVTQMGFASRMAFPVEAPRRFFSGYQDNLGYGYGTALGVAAACPGRAVLSIAGDGGFGYQAFELATAKRHNLPVVVVVFDDGHFGNVKRIQQQAWGGREIANDLANPDFVRFAESFGIAAYRAEDAAQLEARLREAFALRAPALVHVPVGEMPSIWDMILMPQARGEPRRPMMP